MKAGLFVGAVICAATAGIAAAAADPLVPLKMTTKVCSGMDGALVPDTTVEPTPSGFLVDVAALPLSQEPKEILIRRRPLVFFRVPWVKGKTVYEVSSRTTTLVVGEGTFSPVTSGQWLSLAIMRRDDEVMWSCDIKVR